MPAKKVELWRPLPIGTSEFRFYAFSAVCSYAWARSKQRYLLPAHNASFTMGGPRGLHHGLMAPARKVQLVRFEADQRLKLLIFLVTPIEPQPDMKELN